jgi:hypothetical protein
MRQKISNPTCVLQFDGCVAVQASQTEKENEFLLALCNNSSVIKGIVGLDRPAI